MAPTPVNVDLLLDFIEQLPGLCGPACAQMILHNHNSGGFALTATVQRDLWTDMKNNTTVPSGVTLAAGPPDDGGCGIFPQKICECPSDRFCWCTFPAALKATLRQHAPRVPVRVITSTSQTTINTKIIKCLKGGVAPAVLVSKGKHWVVVGGYDSNSNDQVKLFDPNLNAKRAISLGWWNAAYLVPPGCGKFKGKHVVVGDDS